MGNTAPSGQTYLDELLLRAENEGIDTAPYAEMGIDEAIEALEGALGVVGEMGEDGGE